MSEAVCGLTIPELGERFRQGDLTPSAALEGFLERIRRLDPQIHAFTSVCEERARREAGASDRRFRAGTPLGPLDGIPYAVKDILATAGVRTTGNSKSLKDWIPDSDCPAVARLTAAGAVLVGKLTLNELGFGGYELHPYARCPWRPEVSAGGSSAGSGAAAAAKMAAFTLGTDGGGSIRVPAAICGVAGLAGTPGRVDGSDQIGPFRYPSDQVVGPLATTAADARIVFEALTGESVAADIPKALRVGWLRQHEAEITLHPDIASAMESTVAFLRDSFPCEIQEMAIEGFGRASEVNWTFLAGQAAEMFAPADVLSHPDQYTPDFLKLMERGCAVTDTDYEAAISFRSRFSEAVSEAFCRADVLLSATMPMMMTPPGEEELWRGQHGNTYGFFTAPMNLAKIPAISVPVGLSRYGTPIGVQLAAPAGWDGLLLALARQLQWLRRTVP